MSYVNSAKNPSSSEKVRRYLCVLQSWVLRGLRGWPGLCSKESSLVPWLCLQNKVEMMLGAQSEQSKAQDTKSTM